MNKLYLASHELIHFNKIPEAIRSEWGGETEEESSSAYETAEVIQTRMKMLPVSEHPEMQGLIDGFIEQSESAEPFTDMSYLKKFPEALLPDFLFAIGAIGISALIEAALQEEIDSEGLKNLSFLSLFRHKILEANAKYSFA